MDRGGPKSKSNTGSKPSNVPEACACNARRTLWLATKGAIICFCTNFSLLSIAVFNFSCAPGGRVSRFSADRFKTGFLSVPAALLSRMRDIAAIVSSNCLTSTCSSDTVISKVAILAKVIELSGVSVVAKYELTSVDMSCTSWEDVSSGTVPGTYTGALFGLNSESFSKDAPLEVALAGALMDSCRDAAAGPPPLAT